MSTITNVNAANAIKVSTIQELIAALYGESQNDRTRCGWIIFNGNTYYVRKHWSYSGSYPVYLTDDFNAECVGFLWNDGKFFPYIVDGKQVLEHGWDPVYDSILIFSKTEFVR